MKADPAETPQDSTVFRELCDFTGLLPEQVRARMAERTERTARLFQAHPGPPEDFYRETDAYLFELANWEPDIRRSHLARSLYEALGRRPFPVLEYGCGIGSFAFELAEQGFRVVACDVNEPALAFLRYRIARRDMGGWINLVSPETALATPATYAVVSCQHVLEHIADPVALLRALRNSLKPKGVFLGIAPFDAVGPKFPEHRPENVHLRLETLCEEAGFRVVSVDPFGGIDEFIFHLVQAVKPA